MAKKTLWQRIKNFFSGGNSDSAKARSNRLIRRKNTGGTRTSTNRVTLYRSLRGQSSGDNKEEKQSSYKSMADAIKESSKKQIFDPKEAARKVSQENARKRLDDIKKERKEYHEVTGHRNDVNEKGISKEEKAKRRIAQKNQAYDVNAEKFEVEKHPIAESFGRGALSGVTFGASELMAQKSKARQESGAEEFYQKHKNKYAEGAGEIVGSLASFGATAGATEKLATKVGGKAIERGAERLASKKIVQNAAKRSVNKAVKKGLVKEGTEELIKQVGKDKAKKIATALGTDVVQNLTTGAVYDINKASTQHEVLSEDWWKELGTSAALNAAITGGVAGVSAVRGSKGLAAETARRLDLQKGLRELADSRAGASRIRAPRIGESIDDRIARINAENPATRGEVRIGEVDDSIDVINPNARRNSTVEIGAADEGIDVINPNVRANGASVDVPEKRVYNNINGGANAETEIRDIRTAQASGDAVPSVDREISTRSGADNGVLERVADASDDARRRSGNDVLRISADNRAKLTESGVTDTHLSDVSNNYATFSNALDEAKKANGQYGAWVDPKSVDDLAAHNAKTYLSGDGYAGVAVEDDGNISGVFKNPKSKNKGAMYDLIFTARANGGTKMDCFGRVLANGYEGCGYKVVAQLDFNPAFVDDPALKAAKPKIYVLMKNTDDLDTVASKIKKSEAAGGYHRSTQEELDALPSFGDDYEAALKYRDNLLAQQEAGTKAAEAEASKRQPYAMVDEVAEGIEPDTPLDEARRVATDMSEGRAPRDVDANEVSQAVDDTLPTGTQKARQSFEKIRGEKVNKGETPPTTKEIYDAYKEYHISQGSESRRKQSKAAASHINMMTEDAEKALRQRLVESGDADYDTIFTPELYDQISREFKDEGEYWISRISDGADDLTKINASEIPEMQARCEYLMAVLDPSVDEAAESAYYSAMKLAKDIASKSGQTLNIRRNFVKLTRAGKIESTVDDLVSILDSSLGFNKKYKGKIPAGKYNRINFIKGKLMDDPVMEKAITKVVDAKTPEEVSEAYTEMLLSLNRVNPKGGFDIIQEIRYLNMLGNPKTHIRNMFGSGFFAPIRQISNGIRSVIENSTALKNYLKSQGSEGLEKEITRHGHISLLAAKEAMVENPTTEAGKEALKALERRAPELLGSAKYDTPKYVGRGKTLAGKVVDRISDFNSTLLTKEDDVFKRIAFRENYIKSYERYVKDGKPITDKVKKRIEAEALQEAQVATFNEYNKFANWLNKIEKNANNANAGVGARWGGRFVNAVMPFTKVPANLMEQSVNYSPLGIARGLAEIKTAAQRGDAKLLNAAIDHFASGMTGTAIFVSGMLLGKTTEMFTTNAGKNDPAAKFKKDRGVQNYSVTFKDPETGKGYSFTLDWLVPTSATFFSGVELANQLKGADGFNPMNVIGDWSIVASRLAEPVMETSMLSGLHGMLETMRGGYGDDDTKGAIDIIGRETVQSWLNSMIPTALGQAARTAYKTDMQIAGDTDWEYWRNQVKSKAGLANTKILGEPLGADTDAYGNVKGDKGNTLIGAIKEGDSKALKEYGKSALKNFASPSNIQRVDFSEVDNAKIAEYERRVKNGEDPEDLAYLFPKKQYKKKFDLAGEEIKMSNRDLSTYNQAKTTGGEEGMRFILENIMFNRQTLDEKGKKVPADSAYTKAEKQELMNQFKGKSMREVEEWLYAQPEFQSATDAERKRAIEGLWKLTKDTKAVASQRVGEQAVIKAQGGDVDEYNFKNEVTEKKREALEPLIAAGVVTYEEVVDFARNAGKTYYTENDEGGSSATYYNKKEMIQYLIDKGYSYEKAEALFNAFKNANAKPYSGNNLSSGRGRRGYGYRRRRRGRKSSTPTINAKSMAAATKSVKGTSVKLTPPTPKTKVAAPKFKKYEV